jgi:hypothetical protein
MSNLRDTILKKLAGTNSQNPVPLENLRAIAEPICDDPVDLYDLLDKLYLDKIIQRASGYKNSQPFVSYWLTGAIQTSAIPFRISTPAPTPRAVLVRKVATPEQAAAKMHPATAKVQLNTSISPFPQTQEKPMGHPQSEVRTTTFNMIVKKPGMKQTDLIEYILVECPDSTDKQIRKIIENLIHSSKTVRYEGIRAERKLYPITETGKPANRPAVVAPPQAPAAAAKAKPQKPQKPSASPAPVAAKALAAFDPEYSFAFGVRKDGGVAICKDGISVVLARSEVQTILAHTTQE